MRLIMGQFTRRDVIALQQAVDLARQKGESNILVPYYGGQPVQVVDLMPRRMPRKMISIQAHTVG